MFNNIVWSANPCTLKTFIESFPLPQLVQVENGIYSEDDAKTLSAGQILTLHFTKRTDKVLAKASATKEFFVPVNCPCKVEILPTICEDRYYSVQDIVEAASVKFIRVVHDSPPSLRLKAGDILELKKTVEENRGKFIECEFYDKTRDTVRLPLEFKAAFEPLMRPGRYHLQDVLGSFKLPARVKFTPTDATVIQDVNTEVDLVSLGSVLLKAVHEETTIIATSRVDNKVTVLLIPTDLDVRVCPAEGAITGEETYARFCKEIHDGAYLEKVDLSGINAFRLRDEPDLEVLYEYMEVKPAIHPRSSGDLQSESADSDSSDDYEDVLPPRPPKALNPKRPLVPPKPPRQTPPHCPQHEDREFDEVFIGTNENAASWADHCEVPPRPPPRTLSLQTSSTTTKGDVVDNSYDNVQPNENSPKPENDDQIPISPVQTEQTTMTADSDVPDEDDGLYDDNDDGDDDDDRDHDSYATNDDDTGSDHDYLYPDLPISNGENTPNPSQENLHQGKKSSLMKKITVLFKKAAPKSPRTTESSSIAFQPTSSATISESQPTVASSCNASTSILSNSPSVLSSSLDFPDDLSSLSVSEVGDCLRNLNMERHVDTFEGNLIDGEMLLTLNEQLLSSLGVSNMFEQKKIIKFIHGWRPKTS